MCNVIMKMIILIMCNINGNNEIKWIKVIIM